MKNLIYYTLGNNLDYIDLLQLNLKTLDFHNIENIELLIITNEDVKTKIEDKIKSKYLINYHIVSADTLLESSMNKLKIHEFVNISEFDKIIFCDADTLWVKNPKIIFDFITENLIYVTNEGGLMTHSYWGGKLITQEENAKIGLEKIKGINAGFFAFNKTIVNEFEKIENFMKQNIKNVEDCLEQPFLNVYLLRNNIYNTKLNDLITHNGYNITESKCVLVHFAGGVGNYIKKYEKMLKFYESNFK